MQKKSRKQYKKVYLEITNICNLNCEFCPKTKRKPHFLSLEEFEILLRQLTPLTDYVYFHLMGEPLLHPLLGEFLELCSKAQLKVCLTTNGSRLSECREILREKDLHKISISLHSFEANDSPQTLAEYVETVLCFVRECEGGERICVLRLWNRDSALLKAANQRNIDILELLEKEYPQAGDLRKELETKSSVKLCERVFLETAEKFAWPDLAQKDWKEEVFCYGLRDQFGILCDGTVVPCCLDSEGSIALGNALQTPLEEILRSPRAQAIYDGFSKRCAVEALCKRCGYRFGK